MLFAFQKYSAYKYHWSGIGLPTQLEITPCSLDQLDPTSNKVIASYDFKDIVATIGNDWHILQNLSQQTLILSSRYVTGIQDYEQGIVIAYGKFTRLHLFRAANHHEIVQNVVQAANQYMNITIKVVGSQITLNKFEQEKFGPYSYVNILSINFFSNQNENNYFILYGIPLQNGQLFDINVRVYRTQNYRSTPRANKTNIMSYRSYRFGA